MANSNKPIITTKCPENARVGPLEAVARYSDGLGRGGTIRLASTAEALYVTVGRAGAGVRVGLHAADFDLAELLAQLCRHEGAAKVRATLAAVEASLPDGYLLDRSTTTRPEGGRPT